MTWLAMLVKEPDGKPGSTVVITGEKGTGKSTLFDYVNQLLGRTESRCRSASRSSASSTRTLRPPC
jgi:ABC-type lipoprotein export system ATPase subunit